MKIIFLLSLGLISFLHEGSSLAADKQSTPSAKNIEEALFHGEFDAEIRYRYTNIDQDTFSKDAHSSTIRGLFGYSTQPFQGLSAYGQVRTVQRLGSGNLYNDTLNGNTTRPIVADPDAFEIDQAYLKFSAAFDTDITVGRRKIALNNERFISTLPWRQNANSFDGVVLENSSIPNTNLHYSYAYNFNRAFTDDSPVGNFDDADIHLIHGEYAPKLWANFVGYSYLLGIEESSFSGASILATNTYGAEFKGSYPLHKDWKVHYNFEYAKQLDNTDNTRNINLNYYRITPSVSYKNLTVKAGYEVLEGDGTTGFSTPLALLHAYNGFADVFGTTPPTGLQDKFINATYKIKDSKLKIGKYDVLKDTSVHVAYHDFDSESTSRQFGTEFDANITKKLNDNYQVRFDYASYDKDDSASDSYAQGRDKYYLTFIAKLKF